MTFNYTKAKFILETEKAKTFLADGTICTPFPLVDEILDKLDLDWSNPALTFLDPACGRGTFLIAILNRLLKAGHTHQHIVENMLFGVDIEEKNAAFVRSILGAAGKYRTNIECCDALTKDWNMKKFDVVVGNPPYQAPGKENKAKLWPMFFDKSFTLVAEGGTVGLVVPKTWLVDGRYEALVLARQPTYINIDECRKHFPDVHSTFSALVVQNKTQTSGCLFMNNEQSTVLETLPTKGIALAYSGIVWKLLNSSKFFPMVTSSGYNTSGFSTNKPSLSREPTPTHPHYVVHKISHKRGETTGFYSSHLDTTTYGTPRVVVGLWLSDWYKDRMQVSSELLTSQQFRHFPASTIDEAGILRDVLASKLYTFLLLNLVEGNSTKGVRSGSITNRSVSFFPQVDLTRSWTDAELYAHFNLTQEEIDLIESTVK